MRKFEILPSRWDTFNFLTKQFKPDKRKIDEKPRLTNVTFKQLFAETLKIKRRRSLSE